MGFCPFATGRMLKELVRRLKPALLVSRSLDDFSSERDFEDESWSTNLPSRFLIGDWFSDKSCKGGSVNVEGLTDMILLESERSDLNMEGL
jgi:hypothetical protein